MSRKFKLFAFLLAMLTVAVTMFSVIDVYAIDEDTSNLPVSDDETTTQAPPPPTTPTDLGIMNVYMTVGDQRKLLNEVKKEELGDNISFVSNNTSVLSMVNSSDGTVKALREGTVSVKASGSKGYVRFDVKVSAKPTTQQQPATTQKTLSELSGVLNLTLEKGKTTTLNHAGLSGNITYKTGDAKIAAVSARGVVTATGKGTTYLLAYDNTHVQKYQITVTEDKSETVTVTETTTDVSQSTTSDIAEIPDVEDDTTPALVISDTTTSSGNHDNFRKRVLLITAIIIILIIVAAIIIYKRIAARNEEEFPVDFYPENDGPDGPLEGEGYISEDDGYRQFNFRENENGEVETPVTDEHHDDDIADDSEDQSFINDDPDESDDDTFLL